MPLNSAAFVRCISFVSYIKPQLLLMMINCLSVVYLLYPTSNHNILPLYFFAIIVVYLLCPTSNHNCWPFHSSFCWVVYLLYPTSNHNLVRLVPAPHVLYIFCILHQTTTTFRKRRVLNSCISFVSYIKPQLDWYLMINGGSCISFVSYIKPQQKTIMINKSCSCISFVSYIKPQLEFSGDKLDSVVYLLYPTSNHNTSLQSVIKPTLYIFCILHQTTTSGLQPPSPPQLYIFCILHQTTTSGI